MIQIIHSPDIAHHLHVGGGYLVTSLSPPPVPSSCESPEEPCLAREVAMSFSCVRGEKHQEKGKRNQDTC